MTSAERANLWLAGTPPVGGEAAIGFGLTAKQILALQTWLSPAFPTGGFAYSHGLETAVTEGRIESSADLREWLSDVLACGSLWCDAVLFAAAAKAAPASGAALRDIA